MDSAFDYRTQCLFCGNPDKYQGRKKDHMLIQVKTFDFQNHVSADCENRSDNWSGTVRSRMAFVGDLHAADAVYHKVCSVNFHTKKQIPLKFQSEEACSSKKQKLGRPKDQIRHEAFLKVAKYLEENDEELTTICDLIGKMEDFLVATGCDAYGFSYMKDNLFNHFGDKIIIADINGKPNVVTFRGVASSILHDFYRQQKERDPETEKLRLIKTAADLIRSDIKEVSQNKDIYPTTLEMSTVNAATKFLPESLKLLLEMLFVGKGKDLKICSLGQAIMQAARPRILQAPLLVGLGIQMHLHFGSRFLIDTLFAHGYSCSYTEVQTYERSAAVTCGTDIPGFTPGHFIQYVADNVDHDICTLNGRNTFHGMGIIASVTPKTVRTLQIARRAVSAEDIAQVGRINIRPFTSACGGMQSFLYEKLPACTDLRQISSNVDLLWKVSLTVRSPRPSWTGMMQMVHKGEHPGEASIMFLPMIDLSPSDLDCINSTLHFVCEHAQRYGVTPILTFDQPLWWKALTIVKSEPADSKLHSIVLRLGGFHTLMSFLGCIGHLMSGTGLKELLEVAYASNTTTHMMSGKAVSRAIRGHLLVDAALNAKLVSKVFQMNLPSDGDSERTVPAELNDAGDLFDGLMSGDQAVSDIESSKVMEVIGDKINQVIDTIRDQRTARLWLQYMEMVDIIRLFLKSERTGDWMLHLNILRAMLPYLAASGHRHYTKCLHIYLQLMTELPKDHPEVHQKFLQGFQVVRRSDRYWAGLSTDLVIEQVLMRSLKTSGGLTRGRGMTETQRSVWVMASPVCAEVNNALQHLTDVMYVTSEQHKDLSKSRQKNDVADTQKMLEFLHERDPFQDDDTLHNIFTGIVAQTTVNVDEAKTVGERLLGQMSGKRVLEYSFKKKGQAITMDSESAMKTPDGDINIDPQLLFQRLVIAGTEVGDLSKALLCELCAYPPSLFESKYALLSANKPALASAIKSLAPADTAQPSDIQYVLDGGALLQRIPWQSGEQYKDILDRYLKYVSRHYGHAIVVFDGYREGPSTKDCAHQKRGERPSVKVSFSQTMTLSVKKEEFLRNKENKQQFIDILGKKLEESHCEVLHASGDADLLIATTAVCSSSKSNTVLVGEDTDLLILLCYYFRKNTAHSLYLMSEPKKGSLNPRQYLDIGKVREALGDTVCENILFIHAYLGCDTTSRVFGIGKGTGLKLFKDNEMFQQEALIFGNKESTQDEVIAAGDRAMVCVYGGKPSDNLNELRVAKFHAKVTTNKTSLHPRVLPPTSSASKYHSLRVFQQVQEWKGHKLNPLDWGWRIMDTRMIPVHSDLAAAPDYLLKLVRCSCKGGCSDKRCGCRKLGLPCTFACRECRGICANADESVDVFEDADDSDHGRDEVTC
jgi:5'-3' exonuclease